MTKHPILISIPHGGTEAPIELAGRICITPLDLFEDGDAYTREIYGIEDHVEAFVDTSIARAFVDLNRDVDDLPPKNPDGIVKSMTCHGKPIYRDDSYPDEAMTQTLIKNYYQPYHQKIMNLMAGSEAIQLCLDCHTMEPVGPEIAPDSGTERPLICLGSNHHNSCSEEIVHHLAGCFQTAFNLNESDITINKPFAGGLITRIYGYRPLPWIQIEMNRKLYLSEPWFNRNTLEVSKERLMELREKFLNTLNLFFKTQ